LEIDRHLPISSVVSGILCSFSCSDYFLLLIITAFL
jgi:hypothetical protein